MHNDIWAMVVQVDDVELDGDRLVAMQNIRALSRLMALARVQENTSDAAEERGSARTMATEETNRPQKNEADIEEIVGRYIHLDLFGQDNRIYFEEAGEGIP